MAKSFKVQMNETFKAPVKIPRVGGEPLNVTFEFKVMSRKALARMFDEWKKEGANLINEAEKADEAGNGFSLADWAEREIEMQVKQIKDIVLGWGFSDEFSDENIEELIESSVSVTEAIIEQYNEAYTRARQGN